MELGKRIKELRKDKGYTQKEIANTLGVVESAYANWEQGRNEPNIDSIIKLSEIFNVSTDYLFGLETEDGRKIVDLTENRPEGEELLTFPAAARSKGNKIRGGVMLKLTREQLDEIYRQNGIDPNKE